jgi:uncharacterized protein YkwD
MAIMRGVLVAAALLGLVPSAEAQVSGKPSAKAPAKTTPDEQREMAKLLGQFRLAKKDPAKRAEVVAEAVKAGPACAAAMYVAVGKEMQPQLARYSGRFCQQAAAVAKKQIGSVNLEEVSRLRKDVLDLQKQPELTKEMIVKTGDPALKKLEEIFVVDRAAVFEDSPSLKTERDQLQELGKLWEQCAVALYEQLPNDENKPKEAPSFDKYLQGEESLAAGLAAPMSPQMRQVLAANARLAQKLDPEEGRAVLALNLTRNLLGLNALSIDLKLCAAARDHSSDMQRLKFFAHESPVAGKKTPWDRAKNFGTSASAENIMAGVRDGKAANLGWFHSPGHHKNMLGNHNRVGMGLAGAYFTEMLGK